MKCKYELKNMEKGDEGKKRSCCACGPKFGRTHS
jgi:hypothetical protein